MTSAKHIATSIWKGWKFVCVDEASNVWEWWGKLWDWNRLQSLLHIIAWHLYKQNKGTARPYCRSTTVHPKNTSLQPCHTPFFKKKRHKNNTRAKILIVCLGNAACSLCIAALQVWIWVRYCFEQSGKSLQCTIMIAIMTYSPSPWSHYCKGRMVPGRSCSSGRKLSQVIPYSSDAKSFTLRIELERLHSFTMEKCPKLSLAWISWQRSCSEGSMGSVELAQADNGLNSKLLLPSQGTMSSFTFGNLQSVPVVATAEGDCNYIAEMLSIHPCP